VGLFVVRKVANILMHCPKTFNFRETFHHLMAQCVKRLNLPRIISGNRCSSAGRADRKEILRGNWGCNSPSCHAISRELHGCRYTVAIVTSVSPGVCTVRRRPKFAGSLLVALSVSQRRCTNRRKY
jgi:hypothetical protein